MAEGGGAEEERRARRIRLMCPHPPRPFQAYSGPPVAEGEIIATLPVLTVPDVRYLEHIHSIFRNRLLFPRVDCAFDPYSEQWVTASVDVHVVVGEEKLVALNDGPFFYMLRFCVCDKKRMEIPYRRSRRSTSTAFCSDGNLLGWCGYTNFCVYDRWKNVRKIVRCSFVAENAVFSPDGQYLALFSADEDLWYLRIVDSVTCSFVASGISFGGFLLEGLIIKDNAVHLLWSKCGRFLGLSTYCGQLIVFQVKFMIDSRRSHHCPLPKLSHHDDFEKIAHPQAYDFAGQEQVTVLALGTVHNEVRLYEVLDSSLGDLIASRLLYFDTDPDENITINCVRFSNDRGILAVASSDGGVDLLDSVSLLPVRQLQSANFLGHQQLRTAPYFRGFCSLHFACSDNFLVAGATDNLVRVWCVRRPTGPLRSLCRTTVRSRCKWDDLWKLPVPHELVTFLTESDF